MALLIESQGMKREYKHFIDGRWVVTANATYKPVIDPATEEACAYVPLGTANEIDDAVEAARHAHADFARTGREERIALFVRIIGEYKRRIPDLARSVSEEMGAPLSLALAGQVPAGLGGFLTTMQALREFQFTEHMGSTQVVHESIGVVGLITPWNWPLNQIALKVAPALAAGNAVVLKPSEECPGNASILAEILMAAGVPDGIFNIVHGGPSTGTALAAHPGVDMISITGSTRAGISVARAAAESVKRVHQELGGKAANIVLEGANLAQLGPTVGGIWTNSGQSCIAPTRILVHENQYEEAIEIIKRLFIAVRVGAPHLEGDHIGPVASRSQFDKIQELMCSALEEGAKLEAGGLGLPQEFDRGYYIRPTVFSNVTSDMRIAREETFGPIATITAYRSEEEAISIANNTAYGLSSVITGDPERAAIVARRLRVGTVTINNWIPGTGAPLGGYKRSGNGREGGSFGLREFMELKAIHGIHRG